MNKQIEALKLAREALKLNCSSQTESPATKAIAAIDEALSEQPAQQQDANDRFMTVVYRNVQEDDAKSFTEHPKAVWFGWCHAPYQRDEARYKLEKVSASPPASKPLTDEQRMEMWRTTKFRGNGGQVDWFIEGTRAAEAAHGITGETK